MNFDWTSIDRKGVSKNPASEVAGNSSIPAFFHSMRHLR